MCTRAWTDTHRNLDRPGETEDSDQLAADALGVFEALRVQNHFSDEFVIRLRHRHGSEQLLEVIRQLLPASVSLPRGVHRDKDARVMIDVHL